MDLVLSPAGPTPEEVRQIPCTAPHPRRVSSSWFLFIDEFGHRRYTAFTSDSLASDTWTPVTATMPPGASHGSILALTAEEYTQLEHLAAN